MAGSTAEKELIAALLASEIDVKLHFKRTKLTIFSN